VAENDALTPTWSVLICCHNSAARVQKTLEAVANQTILRHSTVELLVVDNASTDNTQEVVKRFQLPSALFLKIVVEPRPGLSFAREAAIAHARGRYLCFLDDDNDAAPDYLEVAQEIFEARKEVCFCGGQSFWPVDAINSLPLIAKIFSKSVAVGEQRSTDGILPLGDFLWGAGLCLRAGDVRWLYEAGLRPLLSGRMGKRVLSGEDGELTILMQLTGRRGYYSSRLRLTHRVELVRLRTAYFSRLFFGMGMAAPVIEAYRSAVERLVGPVRPTAIPGTTWSARFQRMRNFSVPAVLGGVALYCWLGICFVRGRVRSKFNRLPYSAERQAERLFERLRDERECV